MPVHLRRSGHRRAPIPTGGRSKGPRFVESVSMKPGVSERAGSRRRRWRGGPLRGRIHATARLVGTPCSRRRARETAPNTSFTQLCSL